MGKDERESLAGKLAVGVSFNKILDDVRSNVSSDVRRLHLLVRHDLHNIKRDFHLQYDGREHEDDMTSVSLWVQKMNEFVLFFKQQGVEDSDIGTLKKSDFVVIMMSDFQKDLFLKLGGNVVCMDSTHSTNGYEFSLITLLIIDEYGAGVPAAFCLANREGREIITLFCSCIKKKCGDISTKIFMSDDTSVFISSWCAVFSMPERHLLCTWHVDKCWRNNLKKVDGTAESKAKIYHVMRTLLEEPDVSNFEKMMEVFLQELLSDSGTKAFGQYFKDYYATRPQLWAYCYRLGSGINTNMHLEAFHRVLKYSYLEGKKNKRVDKLLGVLSKFVRDKMYDRLVKVCKGKITHRQAEINVRHKAAIQIRSCDIEEIKNGSVYRITRENNCYTILKVSEKNHTCKLACKECKVCVHNWTCTCPDNVLKLHICKHIHAVHMHLLRSRSTAPDSFESQEFSHLESFLKEDSSRQLNLKEVVEQKLMAVVANVATKSLNENALAQISVKLDNILEICREVEGPCGSFREPSNKALVKQRFMTTKKRKKASSVLSKPTRKEKQEIMSILNNDSLHVHRGFDHTY